MKSLFLTICLGAATLYGQKDTLFSEHFELPSGADSISIATASSQYLPAWSSSTALASQGQRSYHLQASSSGQSHYLLSDYFSTLGYDHVYLYFDQIAKLYPTNRASIELSVDSGQSWLPLDSNHYRGSSPNFAQVGYFQSGSYAKWGSAIPSQSPQQSWWQAEGFDLRGIANDTNGGTVQGYPAVRLRFVGEYNFIPPGGPAAGWFLDKVLILGSNCELNPPQLQLELAADTCDILEPFSKAVTFATMQGSVNDTQAQDIGVKNVVLHHRLNGGSWQSLTLGVNGSNFQHSIFLQPGDSLHYYLVATDSCDNRSRQPLIGSHLQFRRSISLPNSCKGGNCNLPGAISQFPWQQGFEQDAWVAGSGQAGLPSFSRGQIHPYYQVVPSLLSKYGWAVWSGSSSNANSGPAKAREGANYIYTEFASASGAVNPLFYLPCFDLSDLSQPDKQLSFYYHMYGSQISSLSVQVDSGTGSWFNYSSIQGAQQSSALSSWQKHTLDLTPFKGQVVKFRFYVSGNGALPNNQVAVDDIRVEDFLPRDLSLRLANQQALLSPCGPDSNLSVSLQLFNQGSDSLHSIPLAYQWGNSPVERDTALFSLGKLAVANFNFAKLIHLPTSGTAHLKVWHELSNDLNPGNDTIDLLINGRGVLDSLPYYFSFNAEPPGPLHSASQDARWVNESNFSPAFLVVNEGTANNYVGGPKMAHSDGVYLLNGKSSATGDTSRLVSACIDLPNVSQTLELRLDYHRSKNTDTKIYLYTDAQGWQYLDKLGAQDQSKGFTQLETFNLNTYKGKTIRLKIETAAPEGVLSISSISIDLKDHTDLALVGLADNVFRYFAPLPTLTNFTAYLSMSQSVSKVVTIGAEFREQCSGNLVATAIDSFSTLSASPDRHSVIKQMALSSPLSAGEYTLTCWIDAPGDKHAINDTLRKTILVQETESLPYFNDFETCGQSDFVSNRNGYLQWEVGPVSPAPPHGGSRVAQTNLDAPAIREGIERLISPIFGGMDTLRGVELRFRHRYDFDSSGLGRVEYLVPNMGWTNLYHANPSGGAQISYTNSSNGWQTVNYPIHRSQTNPNFRFRFHAQQGSWTVDDIELYFPPQHSASPYGLHFDPLPRSGSNSLELEITNTGARDLKESELQIYDQQGRLLLQSQLQFASIKPGGVRMINLGSLNLDSTINELIVVTERPNKRQDALPMDDTLRLPIRFLATYDSAQCFDFESEQNLMPLQSSPVDSSWRYGSPAKQQFNGAYSGSSAWYTHEGVYPDLQQMYLYSPYFEAEALQCYRLSFWHQYDTEAHFDGGNVEVSIDSGQTWQVLGHALDTSWYNTPHIHSLNLVEPGFSGQSQGWQRAQIALKSFDATLLQFRFHFGSNYGVSGEGWLIDDLCFEKQQQGCNQISLGENEKAKVSLYPNPTSGNLHLQLPYYEDEELSIRISDLSGRSVLQFQGKPASRRTLDLKALPSGSYLLFIENSGGKRLYQQRLLKH